MIGFNPSKKSDDKKAAAAPDEVDEKDGSKESLADEAKEPTVLKIPEGVDLQGKGEGDSLELLVKGTLKAGGIFVADSVNGVPLSGGEAGGSPSEPKGDSQSFEDAIEGGMGSPSGM